MSKFPDIVDRIKRYCPFSAGEWKNLLIVTVVFAFMLMFRNWGGAAFSVNEGLKNIFLGMIIVLVSILIHLLAQRIACSFVGFKHEYVISFPMLVLGLLICLATNGYIWFIVAMGGFMLHFLPHHRLGFFRYGLNMWAQGGIAFWGVIATIALGTIIKLLLQASPGNFFLQKALYFNMALAFMSVLPIHPLDGSKILFGAKDLYIFTLAAVIGWSVMVYYTTAIVALISTVLIGGAAVFIFFAIYDKNLN